MSKRTPEGSRDTINRLREELASWSELFLLVPPNEWVVEDHVVDEFQTVKQFLQKHSKI